MPQSKAVNKYKSFTEYYADPEYRRKHLEYVKTRVECEGCGAMVPRSGTTAHKTTRKHKQGLQKKEVEDGLKKSAETKILETMLLQLEEQRKAIEARLAEKQL